MAVAEKLVGFDARVMWLEHHDLWDENRRHEFLLRDNVQRVFSTDNGVWPSVFDGEAWTAHLEKIRWEAPSRPEWIGLNAPLWESLSGLRACLRRGPGCGRVWLIAVSCLADPDIIAAGCILPHWGPTVPPTIDPQWELLGYDVSDGSCTSGLSNCGYEEKERSRLAEAWARRLNLFHLFTSSDHALDFRELADLRVPEHAPFLVCGIYRVEEIDMGAQRIVPAQCDT